jgi:hypothetical protein
MPKSKTLTITIALENSVFDNDAGDELAFILRRLAGRLEGAPCKNKFRLIALASNNTVVGKLEVNP